MTNIKFVMLLGSFMLLSLTVGAQKKTVNDYNVVWQTPGKNSQGSMPIGNGDTGANVWVEENGDLVFYVSKTDAWSEIGRLLKLGKIRVSITPNPFNDKTFSQELKLMQGEVLVNYGDTKIKFWIDANHPVIQVDVESKKPVQVQITCENWRKKRRQLTGDESKSCWGIGENQASKDCDKVIFQEPDVVVSNLQDKIISYHHNAYSIWQKNLSVQALDDFSKGRTDPLLNLNYGLLVDGKGLKNKSDTVLVSRQASTDFSINVFPFTKSGSVEEWQQALLSKSNIIKAISMTERSEVHKRWWKQFWNRSYIFIDTKEANEKTSVENVAGGYILQRFINACGGRGNFPIKFNGSIFTVDTHHRAGPYKGIDADFRLWGGSYWWQNTRLPYWSMLHAGDFDLMKPLFKMYLDGLSVRIAATKKYYGHEGAFYPETLNFWGTYVDGDYGCDRTGIPEGYTKNPYIRYYWQSGLELSLMMLEYYLFTKNKDFARDTLLPIASQVLLFYDQHWERNKNGKIVFDPAMSLETWHNATDPLPEIVGIKMVAKKMLSLPKELRPEDQENRWKNLMQDLPPIPFRLVGKDTLIAPAAIYENKANVENPELYAVFPYKVFGVGRANLPLAIRTFAARNHKEHAGWQQNAIQAACLGLTQEAKKMIVGNFSNWDKNFRFPAFWGPNYDWTPDQCHGGVSMTALQSMLLQYDNNKPILFPAWPREWGVNFKINGPDKTVFEGRYEDGKIVRLKKTKTN